MCESPLTFRAIIHWHDALKAGRMLLRDIVDLEATQGGPKDAAAEAGSDAPPVEAPAPVAFEASDDMDDSEEGEGPGMSLSALERS